MKTIHDLKATLPQTGTIFWIGVRPARKKQLLAKDEIVISISEGIKGDHYSKEGGKRMVTLIQKEHIDAVSNILSQDVSPDQLRRNIVVSGINLLALHDSRFRIGQDVILEGTGYGHPCSRMEENLGPGGYNAMRGHGGITARAIQGGVIRRGDKVTLELIEQLEDMQ